MFFKPLPPLKNQRLLAASPAIALPFKAFSRSRLVKERAQTLPLSQFDVQSEIPCRVIKKG